MFNTDLNDKDPKDALWNYLNSLIEILFQKVNIWFFNTYIYRPNFDNI
jgi:hypothetical protein